MPHRLQTVSVVEAVTNNLRDSLFFGEYAPGQEIKDTDISLKYKVARPTARIAVQQLTAEGVLVRSPGHSARVREFDAQQVNDLFRVRRLIELDAVRNIVQRELPLDEIRAAVERFNMPVDEDTWSNVAQADAAFHTAVVRTADSPRLIEFFGAIVCEMRLLVSHQRDQYSSAAELYAEHQRLFSYLENSSSADEAERAWSTHLGTGEQLLANFPA